MLQYAIEQSLAESAGVGGTGAFGLPMEQNSSDKVDIWEALRGQGSGTDFLSDEDEQLQRWGPYNFLPRYDWLLYPHLN